MFEKEIKELQKISRKINMLKNAKENIVNRIDIFSRERGLTLDELNKTKTYKKEIKKYEEMLKYIQDTINLLKEND